jgi:hypothetical protein
MAQLGSRLIFVTMEDGGEVTVDDLIASSRGLSYGSGIAGSTGTNNFPAKTSTYH